MAGGWKKSAPAPVSLTSLNHISRNCASLEDSIHFYSSILGFVQIKRPGSFDFDGAWLFNYGIGIHLLKDDTLQPGQGNKKSINPKADHISFQCDDVTLLEAGLREHGVQFLRQVVEEGGILVDQLFFHDPDGHMVEICNCQLLPVVPISSPACFSCITSSQSSPRSHLSSRQVLPGSPGMSEGDSLPTLQSMGSIQSLGLSPAMEAGIVE